MLNTVESVVLQYIELHHKNGTSHTKAKTAHILLAEILFVQQIKEERSTQPYVFSLTECS